MLYKENTFSLHACACGYGFSLHLNMKAVHTLEKAQAHCLFAPPFWVESTLLWILTTCILAFSVCAAICAIQSGFEPF